MRGGSMLLLAVGLLASGGCSMCQGTWDGAYGAYGGVVERGDQFCGRVGSIFDPAAGAHVSYSQEAYEPASPFEPTPADPNTRPDDVYYEAHAPSF